ncbi:MAG: hypothetical protein IJ224_12075, partial [Lachnospiraceae bacterium]|nr:hypothetical protein [Lachnospiraceae bacterium]
LRAPDDGDDDKTDVLRASDDGDDEATDILKTSDDEATTVLAGDKDDESTTVLSTDNINDTKNDKRYIYDVVIVHTEESL